MKIEVIFQHYRESDLNYRNLQNKHIMHNVGM